MKVLFIRPREEQIVLTETTRYETMFSESYTPPPWGLMSIATCVNAWTDHRAKVIDAAVLGMSDDDLRRAIRLERPDVVGLPAVSFTLLTTLRTARLVKEMGDIPVVVGGIHADRFPHHLIRQEHVDYVMTGEGEISFMALLEHLEGRAALKDLPGIVGTEEGRVVTGKPVRWMENLDQLPFVDRTLTPYKRYSSPFAQRNPCTIATSSRGCTYNCSFCYLPLRTARQPFRTRSPRNMAEEMRLCADLGIREVFFYDDTFTLKRDRVLEFCRLLRNEDLDLTWDVRTRADCVDRELLREMRSAGLRRIQIGVESGTQAGLDSIQKGMALKQARDAFSMVRQEGLDSFAYFMIGLPGETKDMMMKTLDFALGLDVNYAVFSLFVPLPGSPAWNSSDADGNSALKAAWERYAAHPTPNFDVPIANGVYPKEELIAFIDYAYLRFYLRRRFILREAARIRTQQELRLKASALLRFLQHRWRELHGSRRSGPPFNGMPLWSKTSSAALRLIKLK